MFFAAVKSLFITNIIYIYIFYVKFKKLIYYKYNIYLYILCKIKKKIKTKESISEFMEP